MSKQMTPIYSSIGLAAALLAGLLVGLAAREAAPVHAAASAAPLQQLPTTPTYVISDSVTGGVAYDWIEISNSGTPVYMNAVDPLSGDNWGSLPVDIGFYFPFYENVYRTFRVSTNGYIYFAGSQAAGAFTPIFIGSAMNPNNFIAPFGANLYVHPDVSRIYVERQGARTVIEFVDVQWCCGLNDPHTFEIVLYRDGRILTQYRQVRYSSNPNERVVAGVEGLGGRGGAAYYQGWFQEDTRLDDGLAVLYDPGDSIFGHLILDPPAQTAWDDAGEMVSFDLTLLNLVGFSDTFDITCTLQISSSVAPTASLWPVFAPASLPVTLPNLGETVFQVTATIPITADWWDAATVSVTVSSTSSPTISGTARLLYGVAHRDLRIDKILFPNQPPAPGGQFRYRLTVTNGATDGSPRAAWARGVRVTDALPLSATLLRFGGGNVTTTPFGFAWDVGGMPANGVEILDVYMEIPTSVPTGTVLTNTAWTAMSGTVERGPFDNNIITHTTIVTTPRLFLDIDKWFPGPNVIGMGQVATYTVDVYNNGNAPITGVIVTDVLPAGVAFHATTWPTHTLLPDGRTLVFTIGALLNGFWNAQSFQVGVSVPLTTPVGTWLTNTVSVTTTAPLTGFVEARGDGDASAVEVVDPRGDPAVGKLPEMLGGRAVVPEAGGDYTFWISYTNRGYVPVYTITLTDTLPLSYVTLLEAGPAGLAPADTSTPGLVVWRISELQPGATGWTQVRISIDPAAPPGAVLVNTVAITNAAGANITTTNDTRSVTLTLNAADVTIGKSVAPAGALTVGDWVTYTLRFTNVGALEAAGVRITDVLPARLTQTTWTTSGVPVELLAGPPVMVWRTARPLAAGESGEIIVRAQLDPQATWPPQSTLTNRAAIHTATREEPDDDPNAAEVSSVVAYASPYVRKTGPTLALPGEIIIYLIEYGNGGLLPAQGVSLTDTLPLSTTLVTHTAPFTMTAGPGWIAWEIGAIPSDTSGLSFTLAVSVPAATPIGARLENVVTLTGASYDGSQADNESRWVTPVGFDLSGSSKQINGASEAVVSSGALVTYTIVLTNRGPYTAAAVSVRDPIPANAAYVTNSLRVSGGVGGYDPAGVVTWTGAVAGYGAVTLTFQAELAPGGPLPHGTRITNTAFISDSIAVLPVSAWATIRGADLSNSSKTVSDPRPTSGARITYTIILINSGEADAQRVRLTDTLPLTAVLYAGDGQASDGMLGHGDPLTWTGEVAAGGRVTITLPATVTAGAGVHFVNVAQIDEGAGQLLERSAAASTARPILAIEKTAAVVALASGGRTTYTIVVANTGDAAASSARISDAIRGGVYVTGAVSATSGALDFSTPPTITWSGGLAAGEQTTVVIPVTITAAPGSVVYNTACADDGYGHVASDTTQVRVYAAANIAGSSKQVNASGARPGETLIYTLTVRNSGELPTPFVVTDTLDPNTTFDGFIGTPPGSFSYAAGGIAWSGTVDGGDQARLSFRAVITTSVGSGTALTNTARFEGAGAVYTRTAATMVLVPALLTATKRVEPGGAITAGAYLTYTIVITNPGGDTAHAVFTDAIPAHTTYVVGSRRIQPPPPQYSWPLYDGTALLWSGDLPAGAVVAISFQAMVEPGTPTGTLVVNTAWLQETNEAGTPFSLTTTNTVRSPLFQAAKRADPPPGAGVLPGHSIAYTLILTNPGEGVARLVVTDTLPAGAACVTSSLSVVPGTLPPLVCAGNMLTWQGDVNARSEARLFYSVLVSPTLPRGATVANSALVRELSQPDAPLTVSVTHTVVAPELGGVKRVEPVGAVFAGAPITYIIVMSNTGDAPAQANFNDNLPSYVTYTGASVAPAGYSNPVHENGLLVWNDTIPPGGAVTLTIRARVAAGVVSGTQILNEGWFREMSVPGPLFSDGATSTVRAPLFSAAKFAAPAGGVRGGERITYDLVLSNADEGVARVFVQDDLPNNASYITMSATARDVSGPLTPPTYSALEHRLLWQGDVGPRGVVTLTCAVTVNHGLVNGARIVNTAWLRELSRGVYFTVSVTNTALGPAIHATKRAEPAGDVHPGERIAYHIILTNATAGVARAAVTDGIPAHTGYVTGSASGGLLYDPAHARLTWQGEVASNSTLTLSFSVNVNPGTATGTVISNTAWVDDLGDTAGAVGYAASNRVVGYAIYLPVVLRET